MLNINILAMTLVLIGTIVASFGSMYLKRGAKNFNFNILKQLKNKNLILGIVLFVVGALFYVYALSMERLSILYPTTSLTYIWVALISLKFLGEKMNKYKWLGILFVIIGIVMISFFAA